jgi:FhaA, N-terminal domain/FHA domain
MASLADVERFFERFFERSSATLFRARIQAVQLERRVERSMERARTHQGSRTVVPGRYRVRLNPADLTELAPDPDDAVALAARLADAVLAFARAHAYHVPSRPVVVLVADPSLARGQVEVDAGPVQVSAVAVAPAPGSSHPVVTPGPAVAAADVAAPSNVPAPATADVADAPDAADAPPTGPVEVPVAVGVASDPPGADTGDEPAEAGIRGDGTHTMVYRRPAPPAARALLRVCAPDGTERTIEVDGSPLDLGRSADNRLVLADPRVSRRHGRLQARRGTLVYIDLGSTNGSRVNGIRVDEIALGMGDRVQVGDTVLVVETLPG